MSLHAFPLCADDYTQFGMTLRDYFAGQVLPGIKLDNVNLASEQELAEALALIAKVAYQAADQMLKAREA